MLTAEENEMLTRVGPGTPCGELLRRYWLPICMVPELGEAPTRHVRILGEDLVLFRDRSGRVGLLADHCSHRGASLLYGRVEERGIACAYHGWLYDVEGNCLETPAEPAESKFCLTVKHPAYPVREQYGLYWAYLGPAPAPVLPKWDIEDFGPVGVSGPQWVDCNWLQGMENNMDQAHTYILHQSSARRVSPGMSTTRGRIDELDHLEYSEVPFGIRRQRFNKSGYVDTDLMIFPIFQRTDHHIGARIPVDDTHMVRYSVYADIKFDGQSNGSSKAHSSNGAIRYMPGHEKSKTPTDAIHPFATYRMDDVQPQDLMALETQGPIADRTTERLATSDRGIELYRQMLKREIERVREGLEPMGIVHDPDHEPIDTYVREWIGMSLRYPTERRKG